MENTTDKSQVIPPTEIGREYKHAFHIRSRNRDEVDIHLIKEAIHYSDGSTKPNKRWVKDFKRPFYVTKVGCRDHKQKKEWELIDRLNKFECTQSNLRQDVARALDKAWSKDSVKQLSESPFLYGTDISSLTHLKKIYKSKYNLSSPYTVSVYDTETDVVNNTGEIIINTLVFNNKVFTAIQKSFINGIALPIDQIKSAIEKYIKPITYSPAEGKEVCLADLNFEFEIVICDTEIDIVKACFEKAHEWQPDLISIWNMNFDIPKVIEACQRAGVRPEEILNDPQLPKERRYFKYRQGPNKKVTASGKVIPINPAAQWHSVDNPAGFFIIDAMCLYKHLRLAKQEETSYELDAILTKEKLPRKLKFEQAEGYIKLAWHQFMQTNYKIEYVVYNMFDCISMKLLEDKNRDLSIKLPMFSEYSDFSNFNSQPRRITDALYWTILNENRILGTAAPSPKKTDAVDNEDEEQNPDGEFDPENDDDPNDDQTLGLKGWICTLAASNVTIDAGLKCIEEDPNIITNIRGHTFDCDASAAYPSATMVANVSKETTVYELIDIQGIDKNVFMMEGINLMSGHTNGAEYSQMMYGLPTFVKLLEYYQTKKEEITV